MDGFFVSYRRGPDAPYAHALAGDLRREFGDRSVWMDVDRLLAGGDWREQIEAALYRCDALIALIGPDWLERRDRLETPDDVLRQEVARALERGDITVIPVLVGEAQMPSAKELPEEIRPLTQREAVKIRDDHRRADVATLLEATVRTLPPLRRLVHRIPGGALTLGAVGTVIVVALVLFFVWRPPPGWERYQAQFNGAPKYEALYPEDWEIASDYQDEGRGLWTTSFNSPADDLKVRIDHVPGERISPAKKARQIEAIIRRDARKEKQRYKRREFSSTEVSGRPAWQWNYTLEAEGYVTFYLGGPFSLQGEANPADLSQVGPVVREVAESIEPTEPPPAPR